eukprot:SAG11_NODE_131_length_15487_cov_5.744996_12_plen_275_part_00
MAVTQVGSAEAMTRGGGAEQVSAVPTLELVEGAKVEAEGAPEPTVRRSGRARRARTRFSPEDEAMKPQWQQRVRGGEADEGVDMVVDACSGGAEGEVAEGEGAVDAVGTRVPAGVTLAAGRAAVPAGVTLVAGRAAVPAGVTLVAGRAAVPAGATLAAGRAAVPAGVTLAAGRAAAPAGATLAAGRAAVPAGVTLAAGRAAVLAGATLAAGRAAVPAVIGGHVRGELRNVVGEGAEGALTLELVEGAKVEAEGAPEPTVRRSGRCTTTHCAPAT